MIKAFFGLSFAVVPVSLWDPDDRVCTATVQLCICAGLNHEVSSELHVINRGRQPREGQCVHKLLLLPGASEVELAIPEAGAQSPELFTGARLLQCRSF